MRHEVAELKTKFTVSGVDDVRGAAKQVGTAVESTGAAYSRAGQSAADYARNLAISQQRAALIAVKSSIEIARAQELVAIASAKASAAQRLAAKDPLTAGTQAAAAASAAARARQVLLTQRNVVDNPLIADADRAALNRAIVDASVALNKTQGLIKQSQAEVASATRGHAARMAAEEAQAAASRAAKASREQIKLEAAKTKEAEKAAKARKKIADEEAKYRSEGGRLGVLGRSMSDYATARSPLAIGLGAIATGFGDIIGMITAPLRMAFSAVSKVVSTIVSSVVGLGEAVFGVVGAVGKLGLSVVRVGFNFASSIAGTALGAISKLAGGIASIASQLAALAVKRTIQVALVYQAAQAGITKFGVSSAKESAEFVNNATNQAAATGIDVNSFQTVASLAREYGVQQEELTGALGQFRERISEVVRDPNSDLAQYFRRLGISATDANGRIRNTDSILADLIKASGQLQGTDRVALLAQIFGGDVGVKLAPLFDAMRTTEAFAQRFERQALFGTLVTEQDLARTKDYKEGVGQLTEAWQGLRMTVARRVSPAIAELSRYMARLIAANREWIGEIVSNTMAKQLWALVDLRDRLFYGVRNPRGGNTWVVWLVDGLGMLWSGFKRALDIFGQFQAALSGNAAGVRNQWVHYVISAGQTLVRWAGVAVRAANEMRLAVLGQDDQVTEFPWILHFRDSISKAFTAAKTFAKDAWYAISGRREQESGQFPIIDRFLDRVSAAKARVIQTFGEVRQWILQVLGDVKSVWADTTGELGTGDMATGPGRLFQKIMEGARWARDSIVELRATFVAFGDDLQRVFSGHDAVRFGWLTDWVKPAVEALKTAWEAFDKVRAAFNAVLGLFGTDLTTVLIFTSMLRLSGLLGIVTMGVGLVGKAFVAVFGGSAIAAGVTAIGTAFGGLTVAAGAATAAITGIGARLAGLLPMLANPLIAALIGGATGGVALASWLKGGIIDRGIDSAVSWFMGTDAKLAAIGQQVAAFTDQNRINPMTAQLAQARMAYRNQTGTEPAALFDPYGQVINQASIDAYRAPAQAYEAAAASYGAAPRPAWADDPMSGSSQPTAVVNLQLKTGGPSVAIPTTQRAVDDLLRQDAFSAGQPGWSVGR